VSIDCKATVNIGDDSGQTRGDNQAADHDMGGQEKIHPLWHRQRERVQPVLRARYAASGRLKSASLAADPG
jgi:hypothetical protein